MQHVSLAIAVDETSAATVEVDDLRTAGPAHVPVLSAPAVGALVALLAGVARSRVRSADVRG